MHAQHGQTGQASSVYEAQLYKRTLNSVGPCQNWAMDRPLLYGTSIASLQMARLAELTVGLEAHSALLVLVLTFSGCKSSPTLAIRGRTDQSFCIKEVQIL